MRGFRFYEILKDKGKKSEESEGNCIAVDIETSLSAGFGCYQAVGPVFFEPDSAVCFSPASPAYLAENCKRVSEKRAREIHPELFKYLEA